MYFRLLLIVSMVLLAAVRSAGKQEFNALVDNTNGDDEKKKRENDKAPVHPAVAMCNKIRGHLRSRIGLYWRRKTRLLLITGDEAAIEQLVPGLQEKQWLEGNRTVLIYGGSLTAEPDRKNTPRCANCAAGAHWTALFASCRSRLI
jgi:type VI secretion system protein ImpL